MISIRTLAAIVFAFAILPAESEAAVIGNLARPHAAKSSIAFMTTRANAVAPLGFVRLCLQHPDQCGSNGQSAYLVEATAERMDVLASVNAEVNSDISPKIAQQIDGYDHWSIDPSAGDCKDYAISKQVHLIERGFPKSALRIALAYSSSGSGHAVLVVRTSIGDVVLDNRFNEIKPWYRTDLTWIAIQSDEDTRIWRRLGRPAANFATPPSSEPQLVRYEDMGLHRDPTVGAERT